MSQASNVYPSSVIEGVRIDELQYLIPDDTTFTSPLLSSQPTFDTTLNTPRRAPLVPESLTRIRPDRVNEFLLYEDKMSKEFVTWWLQTDFGRNKRINWDGKHHASCWESFEQVANAKDGKPSVICTRCRKVLDHPATGNIGTSSMNKHLKGPQCQKGTGKPSIHKLLVQAVRIIYIISWLYTNQLLTY